MPKACDATSSTSSQSPCTPETVILLHDTLHVGVRSGLEQVDFSAVRVRVLVDLDLVQGRVAKEGPQANKLLWGLGIVVTDDRLEVEWPSPYSAPGPYAGLSRSLVESSAIDEPLRLARASS